MKKLLAISAILALGASALHAQDLNSLSDFDYLKHHLKVISADDFGGRKPLTEYETKTINYIRDQYAALGLQPACDGGYFQDVEEIKTSTSLRGGQLSVKGKKGKVKVNTPSEIVPWTLRNTDRVDIKNAQFVFAGYGISAPEYSWDDFGSVDVNGKVLLVLENDPGMYDDGVFGGKSMTYYGRADYKFEEAFRRGAAGCLVIHMPETSAYKFSSIQGAHGSQEIALVDADGNQAALGLSGWIAEDAVDRIFKAAGADYKATVASARKADFKAVPLNANMTATLDVKVELGTSHNVIGMIPGTDLRDEAVVVMAHWDHLGIGNPVDGDAIYNGAGDNASGVAGMLAHIRRFLADGTKLRRTVIFAALTSEEDGLLGSEWYSKHPVIPMAKTAAAVNIDGGAPLGKAANVEVYAGGLSSVDETVVKLAAAQGRRADVINPDTRGIFFRTDLFNMLRAGVPGVFVCGGQEWLDPADHKSHFNPPYHHPKDEWREDWDMSGVMDHWNLIHSLILSYANDNDMPVWNPGCGFSRPVSEDVAKNPVFGHSKRELIMSVLDQSKPNLYVPAAFFMHFHNKLGDAAIQDHINFFKQTNMDIVKVQYEVVAPHLVIESAADFAKIPVLGPDFFEPQLEVIEKLAAAIGNEALVIPTVYCPLSIFRQMVGNDHYIELVKKYPAEFEKALAGIVESIEWYMRAAANRGADGFYISTQGREAEIFGRNGIFDTIIRKYDRHVSEVASEVGIFNILHICDWEGKYDTLDNFVDYPASVINPPIVYIDGTPVDMKQISKIYGRPIMGGMNRLGNLAKGDIQECFEEVDRIMSKEAPQNFFLGADCTVPDADAKKLRAVIDYVHSWRLNH